MAGATHGGAADDADWAHIGWLGKLALVFAGSFVAIGLFAIGPALPVLQTEFATKPNVALLVQLIGGITPPVFALCSPLAGKMVSRYGVRPVYLASLAIFIIGGIGPAICSSLVQMLLFRVILGMGIAGAFTAAMAGIARVPERQRHLLYGFAAFVGGAVCIPAFPIVGALAKDSWQLGFLAPLLLLPTGLFALGLPRPRATAGPHASVHASAAESARPVGRLGGVPPQLLMLCIVNGWCMVAISLYAPFLLASLGLTDPEEIGKMLGITALCSLAGSGGYGFVQKLVGTRGVVLAAPSLTMLGCLLVFLGGTVATSVAGLGVMSLAMGAFGAAGYAAAVEVVGPQGDGGAATGLVSLAIYLPQLLFPMVATTLGAVAGPPAVYLLLAVLLVAAVVFVAMHRPQQPLIARTAGSV